MTAPSAKPAPRRRKKSAYYGTPPGVAVYGQLFSKRSPRPADDFSDLEVLTLLLGSPRAAESVLTEIRNLDPEGVGGLKSFSLIGSGQNLCNVPHIARATAARLELLYVAAQRIG